MSDSPNSRRRERSELNSPRRRVVPRVLFSESARSHELKDILSLMQLFASSQHEYIKTLFARDTDDHDLLTEKIKDFIMHVYIKLVQHSSLNEDINEEVVTACCNAYSRFSDEYFRDMVYPARIVIDADLYTRFCNNFWICQCVFVLVLIYNKQRNAVPPATFANYSEWFDKIRNVRMLKSVLTSFFVSCDDIATILTCSSQCRTRPEMTFLFYNIRQGLLNMCGPIPQDPSALECLGQIQGWQCFAKYFYDVDPDFDIHEPYTEAQYERLLDQYEQFQGTQLLGSRNQYFNEEALEEAMNEEDAEDAERWPEDPDDIPIIEDNGARLKFNDIYANTNAPLPVVSTEPVDFETTVQDIMSMDEMPLKTWLSDDPDNIVFKLNSGVYFPTSKSIVKSEMNKGRNVQYNCPNSTSEDPSFVGVEEGQPYFALRGIGCPTGGLVKFSTMQALLKSPERIFMLAPASNPAELMYTTSHDSLYLVRIPFYAERGNLYVSANHCQAGTNQLIYDVVAIASSNGGGKKRKTAAKRPTKRKTKKKLRR